MRIAIGLAITVVGFVLAGRRLFWLYRLIRCGRTDTSRKLALRPAAWAETSEVLGQRKLFKKRTPGMAHAMTFWGFLILIFTIIEAYGDLFDKRFAIPLIGHTAVLGFLEDSFAVGVLVALAVFAVIRLRESPARRQRDSRFYQSHTVAAWLVLAMIALVLITLLMYRAAQTNTGDFPYGWWAFASHAIGRALHGLGPGVNADLETGFLLANVTVIMAFLVFVTYSKHLHIFLAPVNIAFSRRPRALGALPTPEMDMENIDEDTVFGAGRIEQLTWKQLLDLGTCTECGRCQDECPAWNTGKPLSPKLLVMSLRDHLFDSAPQLLATSGAADGTNGDGSATRSDPSGVETGGGALVPTVIDPDVLWSCTTCGACVEQCPVDIEHVDTIVDMRRYEVLMESRFPTEAGAMLRNLENQGDPWGLGSSHRLDWAKDLGFEAPVVTDVIPEGIDYLYWVGCAGALDERARKATQATARILHDAGVSFAVLGPKESCTGDPARRLGNEYLFQTLATQNIATLNEAGVEASRGKTVIASCPHCFNTIANEYPALGGNYRVVHHSQLLDELARTKQLQLGAGFEATVTYHDPCYLGRHNRVFDQPRSVLSAVPGVRQIEMRRCREKGFCCGAGGARMWLEEKIGKRINLERTDEALSTGADVVSTACPYCMIMLDDAVRERHEEDRVRVLDLSQIVEQSQGAPLSRSSDDVSASQT